MIRSDILVGGKNVFGLTRLNENMITMEQVVAKDAQEDELQGQKTGVLGWESF